MYMQMNGPDQPMELHVYELNPVAQGPLGAALAIYLDPAMRHQVGLTWAEARELHRQLGKFIDDHLSTPKDAEIPYTASSLA